MSDLSPPDPRRRSAPAVQRNREPILAVLRDYFPASGTVLELASGTGEHGYFFCTHFPGLSWQPSDVDPVNLASIDAWRESSAVPNLRSALSIDLKQLQTLPTTIYDAAFCANLVHIAPWEVCKNLMRVVGSALKAGAPFVMYGPYKVNGQHTAESNVAFEQWLWNQDPEFGVRDMADVIEQASAQALAFVACIPMPANNFCLVFKKAGDS
jgi:hypothetical protein